MSAQESREESQDFAGRRLVLGFDAGCMTCSDLARRIEEQVGDKLEVKSLRDPQVAHWREEALGEDAPWVPTLIEVKGGEVKARTGIKMGSYLSLALGPKTTWRVMQVLGEIGAKNRTDSSTASKALNGMSRVQFLKGVSGMAVGISALSGFGSLASSAEAAQGTPKSVKVEEITGEELKRIAREVAARTDVGNVLGVEQSEHWSSNLAIRSCQNGECYTVVGNQGNCSVRQVDGQVTVEGDCALVRAMQHELEDGSSMLAVVYETSNQVAVYYEYDKPWSDAKIESQAMLYKVEDDGATLVGNASHNGVLDVPLPQSEGEFTTAANPCGGCPPDSAGPGARGETPCRTCVTIAVGDCILERFSQRLQM